MTDLVEFLLARIAEDEAAARAAGNLKMWLDDRGRGWIEHPDGGRIELGNKTDTELVVGRWLNHVALHMPGRVLAECDAKREIVEALRDELANQHDPEPTTLMLADGVLHLLAPPYADHSDFQQEWRR